MDLQRLREFIQYIFGGNDPDDKLDRVIVGIIGIVIIFVAMVIMMAS